MKQFINIFVIIGFVLFASFVQPSSEGQSDVIQRVASALRSANTIELTKYFNTTVDLALPGKEGSFSKAQAEQITKDFFQKNVIKSFTLNNEGASKGGAMYAIGTLATSTGNYRVYYMIKSYDGKYLIQQLQIEKQ